MYRLTLSSSDILLDLELIFPVASFDSLSLADVAPSIFQKEAFKIKLTLPIQASIYTRFRFESVSRPDNESLAR